MWSENRFCGKTKWSTGNHPKNRFAPEDKYTVYLVRLEGHYVLWVPSTKLNVDSDKYCVQMDWLTAAFNEKRPTEHKDLYINRNIVEKNKQ